MLGHKKVHALSSNIIMEVQPFIAPGIDELSELEEEFARSVLEYLAGRRGSESGVTSS